MWKAFAIACLSIVSNHLWSAEPPPLAREFRGVWVATVANIDWPSKKGLSAEEQKQELTAILDRAVALNLNAVVFQVRPMCDALYRSELEPWSEFITGTMGQDPGYDPLAWAIEESHRRGLELHAWCNPYRAGHPNGQSAVTENHLQKRRPDLVKRYVKQVWLNPTHPDVVEHTLAVLHDITTRYDVDGIHLDDYFYPYPEKNEAGENIPFDDEDTWQAYLASGGKLNRSDWRRSAVDEFVHRWYCETKQIKPWVKVGISPFGIWRPGNPPGIEGLDQYEAIYADAKKWFNQGWVDYFAPQLYWPIAQEKQSYPKLLSWWAGENTHKRHLWPGNIPSRLTSNAKGWSPNEIRDQIVVTRKTEGATGNIHFSMKSLMSEKGGAAESIASVYTEPALVPSSPWLSDEPIPLWNAKLNAPRALALETKSDQARFFMVRWQIEEKWFTRLVAAKPNNTVEFELPEKVSSAWVSLIDRVGNESESKLIDR